MSKELNKGKLSGTLANLEKKFSRADEYFSKYYSRGDEDTSGRLLQEYLKVYFDSLLKTKEKEYPVIQKRVLKAIEVVQEKDEKVFSGKDKKDIKLEELNEYKFTQEFISNLKKFFVPEVLVSDGIVVEDYVSRMTSTYEIVRDELSDLDAKVELIRGYLGVITGITTGGYDLDGEDGFLIAMNLRESLRELEVKDELNDALLLQDKLEPEDVVSILQDLGEDVLSILEKEEQESDSEYDSEKEFKTEEEGLLVEDEEDSVVEDTENVVEELLEEEDIKEETEDITEEVTEETTDETSGHVVEVVDEKEVFKDSEDDLDLTEDEFEDEYIIEDGDEGEGLTLDDIVGETESESVLVEEKETEVEGERVKGLGQFF